MASNLLLPVSFLMTSFWGSSDLSQIGEKGRKIQAGMFRIIPSVSGPGTCCGTGDLHVDGERDASHWPKTLTCCHKLYEGLEPQTR